MITWSYDHIIKLWGRKDNSLESDAPALLFICFLTSRSWYWSIMVDLGRPWSTMVDLGRSWSTMIVLGRPWSTLVDHGLTWSTKVEHGPHKTTQKNRGVQYHHKKRFSVLVPQASRRDLARTKKRARTRTVLPYKKARVDGGELLTFQMHLVKGRPKVVSTKCWGQ